MKTILTTILILITINSYSQTEVYENYIENELTPKDYSIFKYTEDFKVILWEEGLSKSYLYSMEYLVKQDYQFMTREKNDKSQISVYRNCDKNIVLEVTEYFNSEIVVSMKWYKDKDKTIYLQYCGVKMF
ncbi:MAG: hypothetical protein A2X12_03725 [Bacteroidetes bacterium GWE2_29_8]|nr:MAG: hypothetical protein A2X12_03725 [Bacteroidetes bacterium GWE2_29_8]